MQIICPYCKNKLNKNFCKYCKIFYKKENNILNFNGNFNFVLSYSTFDYFLSPADALIEIK